MICRACGSENLATGRFCGACGAPLAPPAAASGTAWLPGGERRQLTVLFCDLVSSTALSERLDPEIFRAVVRDYHVACAGEIERLDGHIAQYLGDGVLAYFGYPHAHEDDAPRAVHASLALMRVVGDLNRRLERDHGIRIQVRVGIHTGPVVADPVGPGEGSEHRAWGPTPNIAAHVQALAQPDTILITGDTYRLVQGFFTCAPLGAKTLKGISHPVETYRVLRDTGRTSRFEVAIARGLTPQVDRQDELAILLERFERVRAGSGEIVWVVGDAGIGKSRLVQIFKARAMAHSPFWLLCRCSSYYATSPLYPVIDLFQRLLGFEADELPADRVQRLARAVAPYTTQPDAVALLAGLLSVPLPADTRSAALSPERQKELTFETLLEILVKMAAERPVVVDVDDLHWADPSTLEFLKLLLDRTPSARILLLLTYRPVFTPDAADGKRGSRIQLERLSDEHVREMVELVAGEKRLPAEVHDYVAERTDGVPIFIEEITRAVLDSGWLVEHDESFEPVKPLQSLSIPVSLQDLLLARLDRLGTAKDLVELAAVVGREFTYEMLRAVASIPEEALRRDLGRLVQGGLLFQDGEPPAARYSFKHALIQEAAYQLLLTNTRQQHHARIAERFTSSFPEIAETRPELIAQHYTEAGLAAPAIGYWLRAGRRDVARSANVEATRHARQGLALLERIPSTPERDEVELALQMTLGSATIALQGYGSPEVERAFGRAQELCERLGNAGQMFRAVLGLWTYYVVRADYVKALELAETLLRLAQAQGVTPALAHAHYCVGFTRYYAAEFGVSAEVLRAGVALPCDEADAALLLPTGDDVRIHMFCFLALALWHLGFPDEAMARNAEAIALARKKSHPYGLSFALVLAGYLGMLRHDVPWTKNVVAEGLALAVDNGYRYLMLLGGFLQGWVVAEGAGSEDGLATMCRAIGGARASGALIGQTLLMVQLAGTCIRSDRVNEARRWLDEAETAVDATGERSFEPEMHRLRALCFSDTSGDAAEQSLLRAVDIARRQKNRGYELRAAVSLASFWRGRGKGQAARALIEGIYRQFQEGFETLDLREARSLLNDLT